MYKNKKNAKSTNLVRIPFYEMTKIRTSSEKFHRVSSIVQNLTFSIGRKKNREFGTLNIGEHKLVWIVLFYVPHPS